MAEMDGKCVVITGASRGIGQGTAIAFANAGANVASLHLPDSQNAAITVAGIKKAGRRSLFVEGSTADPDIVEQFAERVESELGAIDVWINNASVLVVKPFLETSPADWHALMGPNLHGYYNGCRAALKRMAPRRCGRIVNVASVTDIQPVENLVAYVTAKGGVVGMTKALALEFAPIGITVNAISPGAIVTPLSDRVFTKEVRHAYETRIAMGRLGCPEDIADVILFLSSSASRYMTGQEIVVDGGLYLNGNVGLGAPDSISATANAPRVAS